MTKLSETAVDVELTGERSVKRLVTLSSTGPMTLVVQGLAYLTGDENIDEDEVSYSEYYYNESTCPTNYLRDVVKVIDEFGDEDPHGVFEFISIEDWPEEEKARR